MAVLSATAAFVVSCGGDRRAPPSSGAGAGADAGAPPAVGYGATFGQACNASGCAPGLYCRFDRQDTLAGTCSLESGRCRFVTDCPPMETCVKPGPPGPWIGVCEPRAY
ncbi:MAG TPA: hypothetical protein VK762_09415 [Polyangiaceae bacterium]|nr:hypothetical protein [Polyangiaceae bacterium]